MTFLLLKYVPCYNHTLPVPADLLTTTSLPISPQSQIREERIVSEME